MVPGHYVTRPSNYPNDLPPGRTSKTTIQIPASACTDWLSGKTARGVVLASSNTLAAAQVDPPVEYTLGMQAPSQMLTLAP